MLNKLGKSNQAEAPPINYCNYFEGVVTEVDTESYEIGFNIKGLPEFTNQYPKATPLVDTVREIEVNQDIIIFDLNPKIHCFKYVPQRGSEGKTLIKNKSHYIDLTEDSKVTMVLGEVEIIYENGNIEIILKSSANKIDITHLEGNTGVCNIPVCPYTGLRHTTGKYNYPPEY